jgi:hypothetical protein
MKKLLAALLLLGGISQANAADKYEGKDKLIINDVTIVCPFAKAIIMATAEEMAKIKDKRVRHLEAFVSQYDEVVANISLLQKLPLGSALFIINHECAHILNEKYDLPNNEINADLYATYIGTLNKTLDVDSVAQLCENLKSDVNGAARCTAIKNNRRSIIFDAVEGE